MQASVRWLLKTGDSFHSSWSPDGSRLVFNWKPPGQTIEQIYVWNVDLGVAAPISLSGQDRARNNTNPDWSPDGQTIIFVSQLPATSPESEPSQ